MSRGPFVAALVGNPGQHPGFWTGLALISAAIWTVALSAHRHCRRLIGLEQAVQQRQPIDPLRFP